MSHVVERLKDAIVGFSDTLPTFKSVLLNNHGYTQTSVATAVLGRSYGAHNSLADVARFKMKASTEPHI